MRTPPRWGTTQVQLYCNCPLPRHQHPIDLFKRASSNQLLPRLSPILYITKLDSSPTPSSRRHAASGHSPDNNHDYISQGLASQLQPVPPLTDLETSADARIPAIVIPALPPRAPRRPAASAAMRRTAAARRAKTDGRTPNRARSANLRLTDS